MKTIDATPHATHTHATHTHVTHTHAPHTYAPHTDSKNHSLSQSVDGKTLAQYFLSIPRNTRLDAEGEAEIARRLREQDENLWHVALSFAPMVAALSTRITNELSGSKNVSLRHLRATANKCLRGARGANQSALERAARKAATLLREADPCMEILVGVIRSIERREFEYTGGENAYERYAHALQNLLRSANRTRNLFVESNLGLVVSVAKRYQFSGMPLADLVQDGNLGLLRAVTRFDERKGFRFSTYATWWIRHAVGRGVSDKSRTVRVPVHITETSHKLKKLRTELTRELGREPTREEVSAQASMSVRKMEATLQAAAGSSVSLNAPVGGGEGARERIEVFTDPEQESVYESLAAESLARRAHVAMENLAPLEIEILSRRFGLAGKSASTLQDIANHIGKSRERIRQLQEKALLKLRTQLVFENAV